MKYKLFGNSGLRVSELCLGTMTFGKEWGTGADKKTSRELFERFASAGGNFFDTANRYTEGTSEKWLGEFVKHDREKYVIATKYSLYDREGDPSFCGNNRKNMMRSVEDSLCRLNTDYVDLLWVHMWDFTTPEEEVMRGLNDLVSAGKVRYIGISDTPAWIAVKCNALADSRGWNKFAGIQIEYSLIERTVERELMPMAESEGLAVTPWSPLGAGMLSGKYLKSLDGRLSEKSVKMNDRNLNIARKVVEIAEANNTSPSRTALKWLKGKSNLIIPVIGARTLEQLEDNLGVIDTPLSPDQAAELDRVSAVDLGFPGEFLRREATQKNLYGGIREKLDF